MSDSICKNCAAPLRPQDQFCPACGQTAHTHRLDLRHILHEFVHAVIHADKGILYLTKEMIRRPGFVAKDYVEGRRKRYFNPFSYLVITVAVAAFLSNYFHLMESNTQHPNPVSAMVSKNINLVFLVSVPICSFFNWQLFRRSGYDKSAPAEHARHAQASVHPTRHPEIVRQPLGAPALARRQPALKIRRRIWKYSPTPYFCRTNVRYNANTKN